MKRFASIGVLVAAALIALAYADPTPTKKGKTPPVMTPSQRMRARMTQAETTFMNPFRADEGRVGIKVSGEVLDLFCYLDRGFYGELHRQCAYKCVHGGEPMGILTHEGKVYILFPDHWYAMSRKNLTYSKVYDQCKEYAGLQVRVGGFLIKRKGLQGIEMREVALVDEYSPPLPDSSGLKLKYPREQTE